MANNALDLVNLTRLMARSSGRPEVRIALIDGPVLLTHPDLARNNIRELPGVTVARCIQARSGACEHGTLVVGVLSARRGSAAPAICPDCTLLVRPIFSELGSPDEIIPSASPRDLAAAIVEAVDAGARVLNVSAALTQDSSSADRDLQQALDYSASREVITVAAAGNEGILGTSAITRHPSVIPVVACDQYKVPLGGSNLGNTIGRRGLMAPGLNVTSLGSDGAARVFSGTSAAAPFVTGTIALLWSEFLQASATAIRLAVTRTLIPRRRAIAPPLLDAWGAHSIVSQHLMKETGR